MPGDVDPGRRAGLPAFAQTLHVKLTGVNEDQFPQLITAAAAGGTLPDVVGALPLAAVRTMSSNDRSSSRRAATTD